MTLETLRHYGDLICNAALVYTVVEIWQICREGRQGFLWFSLEAKLSFLWETSDLKPGDDQKKPILCLEDLEPWT